MNAEVLDDPPCHRLGAKDRDVREQSPEEPVRTPADSEVQMERGGRKMLVR
jgi:hypothetical protein